MALQDALARTHKVLWIRNTKQTRWARQGQLIGFARATSDGVCAATVWDVAVRLLYHLLLYPADWACTLQACGPQIRGRMWACVGWFGTPHQAHAVGSSGPGWLCEKAVTPGCKADPTLEAGNWHS